MYSKKLKQFIGIIIITAIIMINLDIITIFSNNADAKISNIYAKEFINKTNEEKKSIVKELKELRTINSTTYLLSNGSRKLIINGKNIRYERNGKLIKYNTKLRKLKESEKEKCIKSKSNEKYIERYSYVNKAGDAKHYFPIKMDRETGILLEKNNNIIEFIPQKINLEEKSIDDSCINYVSKEEQLEYKYTSNTDGIKEEIILYQKPSNNYFSFRINKTDIKLEKNEYTKEIIIRDIDTNKVIAYIAAPNIKSYESEINYDEIDYKLVEKDSCYILNVVVDENYFEATNVKYPVIIDPTIVWMGNRLESATVSNFSAHLNTNLYNTNSFEVQYKGRNFTPYTNTEFRCYIDTTNTPLSGSMDDIAGNEIVKATLRLFEYSDITNGGGTIEVRTPSSTWNPSTITWNNSPTMGNQVWAQFTTTGIKDTRHMIDLTEWARAIYNEEIENNGLILKATTQGTRTYFYSSSLSNQKYMQLSIEYWPYTYTANNYYDNAFVVRYGSAGDISTNIMEICEQVNNIYKNKFGLYTYYSAPQLFNSIADRCKINRGVEINSTTINEECIYHSSSCTDRHYFSLNFAGSYRGNFNEKRASILWSGQKLFNGEASGNRSFVYGFYGTVNIIDIIEPSSQYYNETFYTLLHEMAHVHGAPDHYHELYIVDGETRCIGGDLCDDCNPETGRDENCIMEQIWVKNPSAIEDFYFCEDCYNDIQQYIETNY